MGWGGGGEKFKASFTPTKERTEEAGGANSFHHFKGEARKALPCLERKGQPFQTCDFPMVCPPPHN